MNSNSKNKRQFLQGQTYSAPVSALINIDLEGLLCGSGEFSVNDWEREDETLDL